MFNRYTMWINHHFYCKLRLWPRERSFCVASQGFSGHFCDINIMQSASLNITFTFFSFVARRTYASVFIHHCSTCSAVSARVCCAGVNNLTNKRQRIIKGNSRYRNSSVKTWKLFWMSRCRKHCLAREDLPRRNVSVNHSIIYEVVSRLLCCQEEECNEDFGVQYLKVCVRPSNVRGWFGAWTNLSYIVCKVFV